MSFCRCGGWRSGRSPTTAGHHVDRPDAGTAPAAGNRRRSARSRDPFCGAWPNNLAQKEGLPARAQLLRDPAALAACHAAVRAGDRLTAAEIGDLLAQRDLALDAHHCPHGRPTAVVFGRLDLEKLFKRARQCPFRFWRCRSRFSARIGARRGRSSCPPPPSPRTVSRGGRRGSAVCPPAVPRAPAASSAAFHGVECPGARVESLRERRERRRTGTSCCSIDPTGSLHAV
jgi:hypothetical protein